MLARIDYNILTEAELFYELYGRYKCIQVPWLVERTASQITLPAGCTSHSVPSYTCLGLQDATLVGSAEQSFLQMRLNGDLPDGRYCATSACFRNEWDSTHFPWFMKTELIQISEDAPQPSQLPYMISCAVEFMQKYTEVEVVRTGTSGGNYTSDIVRVADGLELGSYGTRYHKDIGYWIYGTGVALPRLTMPCA